MEPGIFQVEFPNFGHNVLKRLNQQRMEGKLCDITIHLQGQTFRAHRAVLAASSPYFHDQVLLKNTSRIVLPGIMSPKAFESILASSYTGKLTIMSPEIVSYLTVASFLQMWHLVDKCTELLQEIQPPSSQATETQSPSSSNYFSPWEPGEVGPNGPTKFERTGEGDDEGRAEGGGQKEEEEEEEEEVKVRPASDRDVEQDNVTSNSLEAEVGGIGAGPEPERGGYPQPPGYSQPSIVPHKRWVYVKPDRGVAGSEEDGQGRRMEEEEEEEEEDGAEIEDMSDEAQQHRLDGDYEGFQEEPGYDEPVDYYGSSDDFSFDRMEGSPGGVGADGVLAGEIQEDGAYGVPGGEAGPSSGPVTPNSDFAAGVYKLYPCQCGKTFTHKSQRDRHMSMHLNVRPFGCPICSKKFKMKHHLVGHMKIHTGHKPYDCPLCGKKFMWRDSFTRHKNACSKLYHATAGPPGSLPDLSIIPDLNVIPDL
ncbi:zinc finger and BTB domain-containing protein 43-like [Callorhinchus milii]|uniref:zinc finger and BTB domain-containing protein 43-like n=1 Tax=Callorhinchus milii TaxID=7868 RepID=UPI00045740C5|nr:zinc finger and BTB domain-containing protein 43-like [Callorhinchus milii]|eukprot:gi/632985104/ref/XP_007909492.1/ PREDICTED: zinc finger and BTB domain-containing protein 43-like [Callorhinchus milii]